MTPERLYELYLKDKERWRESNDEYKESKRYFNGGGLDGKFSARKGVPRVSENIFGSILRIYLARKFKAKTTITTTAKKRENAAAAKLLNQILKSFSSDTKFIRELQQRDENLLNGAAVCRLNLAATKSGDLKITLKTIPTEDVIIDTNSVEADATDANRIHIMQNYDGDYARRYFGKKVLAHFDGVEWRATICETWIKEGGEWNVYYWQDHAILKTLKKPFCNGEFNPFIFSKFRTHRNGDFYGLFRDLKPMQDFINYGVNAVIKMISDNQTFFETDAVFDGGQFTNALERNDTAIQVKNGAITQGKIKTISNGSKMQTLNSIVANNREMMAYLSGVNEPVFATNEFKTGNAANVRGDLKELGLGIFLGAAELMDAAIFEKMAELVKFYFRKEQIFKIADERNVASYIEVTGKDFLKIALNDFDIYYQITPMMSGKDERFIYWSEILKPAMSAMPENAADLILAMLEDIESPIFDTLKTKFAEKQKTQQPSEAEKLEIQQRAAELEKTKAEAENTKADTEKKISQSDVATTIAMLNLQGGDARTQQVRNGGKNGGTTDLRS